MALPAPAQHQPQPPRHQAKGPSPPGGAEGHAMTAPMTRADLEGAVSKLATKADLARLREDIAVLKEKVNNCATKADLADHSARLQKEMRVQNLILIGTIVGVLSLFRFLG